MVTEQERVHQGRMDITREFIAFTLDSLISFHVKFSFRPFYFLFIQYNFSTGVKSWASLSCYFHFIHILFSFSLELFKLTVNSTHSRGWVEVETENEFRSVRESRLQQLSECVVADLWSVWFRVELVVVCENESFTQLTINPPLSFITTLWIKVSRK